MTDIELIEHKLRQTKHLKNCPVYGKNPKDDMPCDCPKLIDSRYIERLELKIRLMRYFVPTEKEMDITNKVIKAVPQLKFDEFNSMLKNEDEYCEEFAKHLLSMKAESMEREYNVDDKKYNLQIKLSEQDANEN